MNGWQDFRIKDLKANINCAFVDGPFGSNLKTEHFVEDGDVYVIDSGFITSGDFLIHREFRTITKEHFQTVKRSQCRENDIIIAKIGANFGMSAILPKLDKPSLVSGNTLKLTINRKKYDLKFIHYVFLYLKESGQIDILVKGSAQPALSMGLLNDLIFSVPNDLNEQTAIAQYLDAKTQAIDKKINLLTKKAETYKELRKSIINDAVCKGLDKNVKLKESEFGIMPIHWRIGRLKDISKTMSSGATPHTNISAYYENGILNWVNTGDLNDGVINNCQYKISEVAIRDYPNLKVNKIGTLLIAMYGATICKIGLLNIEATTNQACCCINFKKDCFSKFIFYWFLANKSKIISLSVGGTQPNISQGIIAKLLIAIPSLEEQTAIANYLDEKTQKIDAIVSNIGKQIDTLKELRKTLINDVVTGKIKVTD